MDVITSLPHSKQGNDSIFVIVCRRMKMGHFLAMKEAPQAPEIA
jgi:hypothetical protein